MDDLQMNYEDYNDSHYDELARWWRDWDIEPISREMLPRTGVVVLGLAAGFLYCTDSNLCILDCYVSNPDRPGKERTEAIDIVTYVLIEKARAMKFGLIKADTKVPSIKERAIKNGFHYVGEFSAFSRGI